MTDHAEIVGLARRHAVRFDLSADGILGEIVGADRVAFLQRIASNNVAALAPGQGHRNTLLTKQSGILTDFHLFAMPDRLFVLASPVAWSVLCEHLDAYRFSEDVAWERRASALVGITGPAAPRVLRHLFDSAELAGDFEHPRCLVVARNRRTAHVFAWSFAGDEGYLIAVPHPEEAWLLGLLDGLPPELKAPVGTAAALAVLQIEAGHLRPGVELDTETRILDAGLGPACVDFDKGCFPGQEVVARIRSRGEVSRRMVGLAIESGPLPRPRTPLLVEDKGVGEIRSSAFSPTVGGPVAIALLQKRFALPSARSRTFDTPDGALRARVVELPFYRSPALHAAALAACHAGVDAYHADRYDEAMAHFERALRIQHGLADAMEGIGLCLERMGRTDDALRATSRYAERHPDALMAHTNLSRLYMQKGWKEKAEEEQARATMLKFRQAAGEGADVEALVEQQQQQQEAERRRKLGIFRQVLEMDPDDEVANFGIGSVLLDSGDGAGAIPHLERVVRANPDYSAAYERLARAQRLAGRTDEALDTLRRGIAVATQRGDRMPQQSMEQVLRELSS